MLVTYLPCLLPFVLPELEDTCERDTALEDLFRPLSFCLSDMDFDFGLTNLVGPVAFVLRAFF